MLSQKKKINPRMTVICFRSVLPAGFRFQYQLINLVWLSIDFFYLAEANLIPRAILKNQNPVFRLPRIVKRWGQG